MCDCAKLVNVELAKNNTQLQAVFSLSGPKLGVLISTEKVDSKKRIGPVKLFASFCPFCGEECNPKTEYDHEN